MTQVYSVLTQVSAACALRGNRLHPLCGDLEYHDTKFSEALPTLFQVQAIGWASTAEKSRFGEPRVRQASPSFGRAPMGWLAGCRVGSYGCWPEHAMKLWLACRPWSPRVELLSSHATCDYALTFD